MPKILIRETDLTTPGSANSYANYSVLIPGFHANILTEQDIVQPDANGVYEFTSASAFETVMGLVRPTLHYATETQSEGSTVTTYNEYVEHYGNQMAYELLNAGYSVLYVPLARAQLVSCSDEDVDKVLSEDSKAAVLTAISYLVSDEFWSVFKDKASYDFRFICHGLLTSNTQPSTYTTYEATVNKYKVTKEKLESLKAAINIDNYETADDYRTAVETSYNTYKDELADKMALSTATSTEQLIYAGLTYGEGNLYEKLLDQVDGTIGALKTVESLLAAAETTLNELAYITPAFINKANGCIANLAMYKAPTAPNEMPGRGDCTALIELCENTYTNASYSLPVPNDGEETVPYKTITINSANRAEKLIIRAINSMSQINAENGTYCALTVPSVVYTMEDNDDFGNNKKLPGSFHYLTCFMNSLKLGFNEWYAAAGYSRGVSNMTIDHTTVKLGEVAINALEPRCKAVGGDADAYPNFACNVIANFRGSYYLWGNRTAHPVGTEGDTKTGDLVARHFLNIRQLCSTIKKQLYMSCRRFTFDPNSDTLWINFVNAIRPTLERMKADQGVKDYKIIKVATDKKATVKAKIRIIPIEAVEDFDLEITLEDSFGETAATAVE